MNRARVFERWAKITSTNPDEVGATAAMSDVLRLEEELCRADMKRWLLRAEDVADAKWWMPHKIVEGAAVKIYYTWVRKGVPPPDYEIVLVVGGGIAQIHKWRDNKLVESTPAKIGEKNGAGPSPSESLQIANYVSQFAAGGGMTVDGREVKKIK